MHIELYRRFIEALPSTEALGEFMPYEWASLPDPLEAIWMVYSFMLDDFARELANAINAFTLNVRRLSAWESVIADLPEKERNEAMYEFVEPLATLYLLSPYAIRSRFIFSTAHLCHQVNLIRDSNWSEASLPTDDEIYMDSADTQGRPWKRYVRLKTRIEAIGGKALRKSTADFRNAFSHRFSARIGQGVTNFVTRYVDPTTEEVTYGFGGTEPLALREVVALLTDELDKCYKAFGAFRRLVAEHLEFIVPCNDSVRTARELPSPARA